MKGAQSIVDGVPTDYSLMAQSAFLELYLHPTSAQIGIRDLRAGHVWLSNPTLPHPEMVPESLRAPFDSVFFAFFTKEMSTQMRREVSMAHVPEPEIEPTVQGATVYYEMEALGFSMTLRYELGPDYLDVTVDEAGLAESADHLLVAIDILPYLGQRPMAWRSRAISCFPMDLARWYTWAASSPASANGSAQQTMARIATHLPGRRSSARPYLPLALSSPLPQWANRRPPCLA